MKFTTLTVKLSTKQTWDDLFKAYVDVLYLNGITYHRSVVVCFFICNHCLSLDFFFFFCLTKMWVIALLFLKTEWLYRGQLREVTCLADFLKAGLYLQSLPPQNKTYSEQNDSILHWHQSTYVYSIAATFVNLYWSHSVLPATAVFTSKFHCEPI